VALTRGSQWPELLEHAAVPLELLCEHDSEQDQASSLRAQGGE
jgi:hypothetical protein